jgi:hypothetical protein
MKKRDDKDMIVGLISSQKQVPEKRDSKKNYNAIVNRIINILRNKDHPCSLSELQKEMKDFDLRNKEFLTLVHKYDHKIKFDEKKEIFYLKSKYIMQSIEDLKDKIRSSEHGLLEDEELTDSYPGIRSDIEKLKRENYVKVIFNGEKNTNVLFYRDSADKFEKLMIDPEYTNAIFELRKIWKDELGYYDTNEKNFLVRKRLRTDTLKKKGEKRRRIKQWQNIHVDQNLLANNDVK